MERTRYIVSDLHIGPGDKFDSFSADKSFKYLLEAVGRHPDAELIVNGDFIDFMAVTLEHETARPFSRLGCTEKESVKKLERVIKAHPVIFSALRKFLSKKGHRLVLVPGNHDIDLFWPGVRDRLQEAIGAHNKRRFYFEQSGVDRDKGLYAEHGNQYFADTVFEQYSEPFLRDPRSGELRLERCWADCFLSYIVIGLMAKRNPFFNNVMPYYDLILMCIQEEAWWPKLIYACKLLRFLYKVGFPPLEEGRAVLLEKRMIGGEEEEFDKDRFLGVTSRLEDVEAEELVDTMQWEHGYPLEPETEPAGNRVHG